MTPKQKVVSYMKDATYKPMTAEELVSALEIQDVKRFMDLLNELEQEGTIILTRKNRYGIPEKMGLVVGRLHGHPKGFGFVIPKNPEITDIYVNLKNMNGAMHNDRVIVRPDYTGKGKPEGEVIRIIEHANKTIVGTYEESKKFGFVIPDDHRIYYDVFIPPGESKNASNHDKVVAKITRWPNKRRSPEGKITEVIGPLGIPGVDILSIIKKYKLPLEFSKKALKQANKVPQQVSEKDIEGRRDMRHVKTVTIDGADAKDLDDAVSIEVLSNGNYSLGVHIADVSHYIKENMALDKEAFNRGTSVYLVDRVVPMLPPELSNGICSLNAGEDRLALSVQMEVDSSGKIENYQIFNAVINVDERMTYENVKRILVDDDPEMKERYADFLKEFSLMEELCLILKEKRLKRGAIDFDFPEGELVLDENGKPTEIVKKERSIADKIIEEFMILANETIASHLYWLEVPALYRIHEKPEDEAVAELNSFLRLFGHYLKGIENGVHPKAYQEVVQAVRGRPEEKIVNTVVLRSMKHARYREMCVGHFGLASEYYTHFTSPIRRYPDLEVHRIVKETLSGHISKKRREVLELRMPESAENSSVREQVAEEAERDCVDMKKAEYMESYVGETLKGIISSVLSFGFFVELPNTVEGLVHISTLTDDYYIFWDKEMMLVGDNTRKTYRIGDEVKIVVTKVNVEERHIDFEIAENEELTDE